MDVLKILILEDVENDVELIKREIQKNIDKNFIFKWVKTEAAFTSALNEFHPDIILSDYNLPQFNGFEALKIARDYNDLIPFIIVTGTLAEEIAADSIKIGAWDYVVKERLQRLPQAITTAIKLRQEKLKARKAETELDLIKDNAGIQLKLLYQAINHAPSSFIITNPKGVIQYVNPRFEEVSGYKAEEVIGEKTSILKSGQHDTGFYKTLWDTILNGDEYRGEMVNRKKNGELYWEMVSITSLKSDTGEIEHFVAVKRDITEYKMAQRAIAESENLYRTIFENTGTATIIVNKEGYITLVNSKFEELSGETKENIEGKLKWMDFITKKDLPRMMEYQKKRLEKAPDVPKQYEFLFNRADGQLRNIYLMVELIPGTTNSVASLLDITERKKMEADLQSNKEKYQELVENINDVIFETDTNGIITYISPIIKNITGFSDEYYLEKSFFDSVFDEDLGRTKKEFGTLLYENIVNPSEFRAKTKSGKLVWIRVSANRIIKDGEVTGIRGLAVDVTKQKEVEDELIEAKEKAEESDRLKSAFLATMSHELRTPLNAIIGFSEMFDETADKNEMAEMGRIIYKSGTHLLNIIEDIFQISLLQTKEHQVVKEKFNAEELFTSLEQFVSIELKNQEKTSLDFKTGKPAEEVIIYTDKTKLNQLLINLLKNAIKFTEKGAIRLQMDVDRKNVAFKVNDTGIGIAENKKEIIFEQFRQADDSFVRQYGGVGLGLAISKEISKLLDGELTVNSTEGKGSEFIFKLDNAIVSEKHKNNEQKSPSEKLKLNNFNILVAEDVESNYLLLKNYIKISGANTIWAKNGEEAIEICRSNPNIHLVFMDIRMPGIDGFEATSIIKKEFPDLKIIAQTAYAMKDDKQKAIEAGCDDYISKPIRFMEFNKLLKKYLLQG